MKPLSYTAGELFDLIRAGDPDLVVLDVRNEDDFGRFKVEGPEAVVMLNVPYIDFSDDEEEDSVAKVPRGKKIRIVCAKENSARFVGEVLINHGFDDVGFLEGGINTWGNLLVPFYIHSDDAYRLVQFVRPGKASCSYAIVSGSEMMVFDPCKEADVYLDFASANGASVTRTFETHLQADYISGSPAIAARAGAALHACERDFEAARFTYEPHSDGQVFRFSHGGPTVRAIHTPGHTPGSTCYLVDEQYLISGDTVFIVSIGRPDLGGKVDEWSQFLFDTLKTRIEPMPDSLVVLPGHFMNWSEASADLTFQNSLGAVKKTNASIFSISDPGRFAEFIKGNMRPQPEVYAKIRQVNAGLLAVEAGEANVMDLGKNECAASQGK